MKTDQGGTKMHCPKCGETTVCRAISITQLREKSGQRKYMKSHPDIKLFQRGRECLDCGEAFLTAEIDDKFLFELVELRDALKKIKKNAEKYIKESSAASKTLVELNESLGILKALDIYKKA